MKTVHNLKTGRVCIYIYLAFIFTQTEHITLKWFIRREQRRRKI